MNVHDAKWYLMIEKLSEEQKQLITDYIGSIDFEALKKFYEELPSCITRFYGSMDEFGDYNFLPSVNDLRTEVIRMYMIMLLEREHLVKGRFRLILDDSAGLPPMLGYETFVDLSGEMEKNEAKGHVMQYHKGDVVSWVYNGMRAVGVIENPYSDEHISYAVNYKMNSKIEAGDIWSSDRIHTDEDSEIRLATTEEAIMLMKALRHYNIVYFLDGNKIRV